MLPPAFPKKRGQGYPVVLARPRCPYGPQGNPQNLPPEPRLVAPKGGGHRPDPFFGQSAHRVRRSGRVPCVSALFSRAEKEAKGYPDYASGRLSLYANRCRPDGLHHPSPGRTAARNGLPIAWTFFYPRGPFPKRMTGQKSCRAEGAAPRKPGTVIPLRIRSATAWGTAR